MRWMQCNKMPTLKMRAWRSEVYVCVLVVAEEVEMHSKVDTPSKPRIPLRWPKVSIERDIYDAFFLLVPISR